VKKQNKQIECVLRFMKKNEAFFMEITDFLIDERLMKREELTNIDRPTERAKFLVDKLQKILDTEAVMLVDWEWIVLPVERLKILIVTDTQQKEFAYGH
jgi:hypothetical protein